MEVRRPQSETELMERARAIAGRTLGELARSLEETAPGSLNHAKGWAGRLIELCLGAPADNKAAPDFENLGIELKTLPVDETGRPRESTYLCTVDLRDETETWETSRARHKLAHVLWIPLRVLPGQPPSARLVGHPILWHIDNDEADLKADWESHMDLIRRGLVETITGHDGRHLQIRPKAANSESVTWGLDPRGEAILTLPRGFYLRASLTGRILRDHFNL
ncbi:MAG: DNA mismatch repair endonuclease MutH [Bradymonadaceae bacterium]